MPGNKIGQAVVPTAREFLTLEDVEVLVPAIRVIYIDPIVLERQCFISAIENESDLNVVGGDANFDETMKNILVLRPDIVICGFDLGSNELTHMVTVIRRKGLDVKVVILSDGFDFTYAVEALCSGVSGVLSKKDPVEFILSSLRHISRGNLVISGRGRTSETLVAPEDDRGTASGKEICRWKYLLTMQEMQILECAARGLSVNETRIITAKSYSSIKNIRKSAFSKLNVPNAPAAVYMTMKYGILK